MVVRIVIAGESQCDIFGEVCLVADYLSQNLPNFCYERIEKSVLEWKPWLCKINKKNKWHHNKSPLVWKELLMKGSKPYYIGSAAEFLDYCHSYYEFDSFLASAKFEGLVKNFEQYKKKVKEDSQAIAQKEAKLDTVETPSKTDFVVCLSGAGHPLAMHIISGLLDMAVGEKCISRVYIYDRECSITFMEYVERDCSYVGSNNPVKLVKYVEKIGVALTTSDLLIILDHVPFNNEMSVGEWLNMNKKIMKKFALMINASASRKMYILLPNIGPACFNATILMESVTNVNKNNIVVATSDLGLDICEIVAEIAQVPVKNMFCPPVWGFVGINQLVDIRTTIHKYDTFEPYNRYVRVRNSSLQIGSLTPEMRSMEYLMYFDDTLWKKVAEKKSKLRTNTVCINKSIAVLDIVKLWLIENDSDYIVNLGIRCDGSFGLSFEGVFSQPARLKNGEWRPANDFMLPRDPEMSLSYLEKIANLTLTFGKDVLPKIVPYYPCICKPLWYKKKQVW